MKINKMTLLELLRVFVAIFASMIIVFVIIFLVSEEPVTAIKDFIIGPFTSVRRMGNIVEASIPITFTGLAVVMLYRAGLFNLSMEGAFFIGSVAATASALMFDLPPVLNLIVAMFCAMLAGGLTCLIPGFLKVKCNANELVTSLMLNYVMLFFGLFIITEYFYDPNMNSTYSYMFDESMFLPRIIEGTRINIGIFIAMASTFILWLILNKTSFGYKVTLVGKNGQMAKYSGLKTGLIIMASQFVGGMFAGLGGSVELFGMYKRFQYTALPRFGWDGVLIAIVARYKAKYVPLAALFLAYLRTGADIMSRNTDIPYEIITIIQGIVIVLITAKVILANYRKKVIVEEVKSFEEKKVMTE
ncbi:ABC transporter permease [Vallitalea okinawensis]|uniref:ABC transporter permease n=1 Tax=Vallitalea okinawensis TaxID=2078660 RepID=UPI000CFD0547|nr:ABC transporter permease [Vallitalea okinawensis]